MWRQSTMWITGVRDGVKDRVRWSYPAWTRTAEWDRVYRGLNTEDWRDLLHTGFIRTDKNRHSSAYGASFALTAALALSYVQGGLDNPRRTGHPVYVLEVARHSYMHRVRAGYDYLLSDRPVPVSEILRVFRFDPDGRVHQSHTLGL